MEPNIFMNFNEIQENHFLNFISTRNFGIVDLNPLINSSRFFISKSFKEKYRTLILRKIFSNYSFLFMISGN